MVTKFLKNRKKNYAEKIILKSLAEHRLLYNNLWEGIPSVLWHLEELFRETVRCHFFLQVLSLYFWVSEKIVTNSRNSD